MIKGAELGKAIETARAKMGISKKDLAARFGVKPPSIQDWVNRGTIDKERLFQLIEFFSGTVDPGHWGLTASSGALVSIAGARSTNRLESALHAVADALAAMPPTSRPAVATTLDSWARAGGDAAYMPALVALLATAPRKQPRKAA